MLTPGRILYQVWHRPRAAVARCIAEGGPVEQWRTARGRAAMAGAAARLPPLPAPGADTPAVHLLSGARFWDQTAFCVHSFATAAGSPIRMDVYDDRSLRGASLAALERLGPAGRIHRRADVDARVAAALPPDRYPVLHERRANYPNIRKLIDVHAGGTGWKLVLDSDLLFFRRPDFLLAWLAAPDRPLHAVDCEESYGYSRPLLERLAGAPIPPLVNVGLCGLRSDALDWEEIESWCRTLIAAEGTHYYLEQALVALLAARQPCAVAPAADYVTWPRPPEADDCRAVMHHYVAESKPWYFRRNWRRIPVA